MYLFALNCNSSKKMLKKVASVLHEEVLLNKQSCMTILH